MSEVQSRGQSSRGRGSFRGGRGGYRGTRGGAKPHGRSEEQDTTPSLEDQGEVGELKAKYSDKLPLLREVCEGWSDEDLVFALRETDGDVEMALDRITTGAISQWGEVKKKSAKTKESTISSSDTNVRGRSRGSFEGRGRGRGTERGGRAGRGGRAVSQANGTKTSEKPVKTTTEEPFGDITAHDATTIDTNPTNGDEAAAAAAATEFANEPGKDALSSLATDEPKPASAAAPTGRVSGWAGLFAKPTPPPAPKKAPTPPAVPVAAPEEVEPVPAVDEPPAEPLLPPIETEPIEETSSELPSAPHSDSPAIELEPPHDQLTEKNLDKLPDSSNPPPSITVASTTASTQDPMNPAVPIAPVIRPGMSGFAASALKATTSTGRSASYSRKLMDQQEAVVMPGNHAIDRAAVQFGKMGLNGDDMDADEEREEPETRTQLLDDSPAAPRASLPPASVAPAVPEPKAPTEVATEESPAVSQRPAPGLPPAPASAQQASPPQSQAYTDQYRYSQGQKAYDPFTQQPQSQAAGSEPFSNQVPGQSQGVPGSGQDYGQYYGGNRDAYQQYYGGYSQVHDSQRTGSAFGTSAPDTQAQYATARPQQGTSQPDAQNSGNNTPNPSSGSQPQSQYSQQMPGQGGYSGHPYSYPNAYGQQYPQYGGNYMNNMNHRYGANRPMFDDVRREGDYYGNQYGYGHTGQYGSSYKSNMYAQPQQHQHSHDYSSSPANTAGFGGREASYGRAGSAQPSETQQSSGAGMHAFAGMQDPFGRTASGFGQTPGQASHQGSEEQSKASGPSPSLQGGRPGSVNNMGVQQGGLPHPQSQHSNQGFGGYQQYGGFGNQSHQNTGYSYGSNTGFGGYGGYGGGGGGGRGWAGYGSGQH